MIADGAVYVVMNWSGRTFAQLDTDGTECGGTTSVMSGVLGGPFGIYAGSAGWIGVESVWTFTE